METKIIQITAGRGPAECAEVVAQVLSIFLAEAKQNSLSCTLLHKQEGTSPGSVQSVCLSIAGKNLQQFLPSWLGTIQWIGTSELRKNHKRKNWFVACAVMEEALSEGFDERQVQYQAVRSSGPGGQHVNKVSTAIRATYLPTGIQVLAMDSRSQLQNKKAALERLRAKVEQYGLEQMMEAAKAQWQQHLDLQRGNRVRVFTGTDFKKQTKEKSYKTRRAQLKNTLRQKLNENDGQ